MAAGSTDFPRQIEKVTGCVECMSDGYIHILVPLGGSRIAAGVDVPAVGMVMSMRTE
jgi:hypothetical protein